VLKCDQSQSANCSIGDNTPTEQKNKTKKLRKLRRNSASPPSNAVEMSNITIDRVDGQKTLAAATATIVDPNFRIDV
jgi:hypothetical protein